MVTEESSPDPPRPSGSANRSSRQSAIIRRVGKNSGWLAGSAGFSAVASLIYVALTARTLGPLLFGSFALVMTYGEFLTNVAQFQSWKAITSFGAAHFEAEDKPRLARLFGYTARLDCITGVLGAVVAVLTAPLIAPLLHWSPHEQHAAAWFGAALLLTSSTTPAGMLRLFNRFDLQVLCETLTQMVRLAGCVAGWAIGAGVDWFLWVWAIAALLLLVSQLSAVLALGLKPDFARHSLTLTKQENVGLWPFMLKTNLSSSLGMFWMQFGTLAVGAGAGAVEAGGFRLAHRFSLAIMKPVEIATKALFPELARLVAEGDRATVRKVLVRVSGISACFAVLVVIATGLWGREILALVAGRGFDYAHEFLFLLSIAAAVNVVGFALEPFLNAHFRAGTVLRTYVVAALVYGLLLAGLLPLFGADGAAFASIAAALAVIMQMGFSTARLLAQPGTTEF